MPHPYSGALFSSAAKQKYFSLTEKLWYVTKTNRVDGLVESWVCMGKIKHKKAFCPSLSIRGDRLRQAAAQAMGMDAFDDRAFTEQVEKIVTTEGEALEFHFFDGRVKEVPLLIFRSNHNTLGANLPFPGYNWTSAGYVPKQDEVPMVRMVYELYADGMKIERIREAVEAAGYSSFRGKVSHRFITRMLDDERYSVTKGSPAPAWPSGKASTRWSRQRWPGALT